MLWHRGILLLIYRKRRQRGKSSEESYFFSSLDVVLTLLIWSPMASFNSSYCLYGPPNIVEHIKIETAMIVGTD